jgi:hypothetical protein
MNESNHDRKKDQNLFCHVSVMGIISKLELNPFLKSKLEKHIFFPLNVLRIKIHKNPPVCKTLKNHQPLNLRFYEVN